MTEPVVDPRFAAVAEALPGVLRRARGGALAVYLGGELVLDTWTGSRDDAGAEPWAHDTMAMAWSATKGVSSAVVHLLVQRGHLGLEDPVADHWPEFASNGKAATTVGQVLAQEAGLHAIRHLVDDGGALLDHERIAAALASASPAYEPGTANGYHALTFGFLVDELVRRVSGHPLAQLVQTELAEPLALDGFAIGLPEDDQPTRVSPPPTFKPLNGAVRIAGKAANVFTRWPPVRLNLRTIASAFVPRGGEIVGTPAFVASGNGSVGGVFTARSLARFYSSLITDTAGYERIWTPETLAEATRPVNDRRDLVLSIRPRWRAGYHQPWPRKRVSPSAFGFWGMYGSGAWADPERGLAVALVCPDGQGLPLNKINGLVLDALNRA